MIDPIQTLILCEEIKTPIKLPRTGDSSLTRMYLWIRRDS